MDKGRHPQVIRTWKVERTRQPVHEMPPPLQDRERRPSTPKRKKRKR